MNSNTEATVTVPSSSVGLIIGRGGTTMKHIQDLSGSRIRISPTTVDDSLEILLQATETSSVEAAKILISAVVSGEDITTWDTTSLQHAVNNQSTGIAAAPLGGGGGTEKATGGEERMAAMDAAISTVFSQMSFGGDVDPEMMARVMATMKADMMTEVGAAMSQQQTPVAPPAVPPPTTILPPSAASPSAAAAAETAPSTEQQLLLPASASQIPAQALNDASSSPPGGFPLSAHVHLVRFDGAPRDVAERCAANGFAVGFNATDTVDAFVARALAQQGCGGCGGLPPTTKAATATPEILAAPGGGGGGRGDPESVPPLPPPPTTIAGVVTGDVRVDRGSPTSGLSPATAVQPTWQTMGDALGCLQRRQTDSAAAAATAGSESFTYPTPSAPPAPPLPPSSPPSSLASSSSPLAPVVLTIHWYPGPPPTLEGSAGPGDWVRVVTVTKRSLFVGLRSGTLTLAQLQRSLELTAGVPVEWQRLVLGNGRVLGGGGGFADKSGSGGSGGSESGSLSVSDLGIRPRSNIYLTARVEGGEYGGANAKLN